MYNPNRLRTGELFDLFESFLDGLEGQVGMPAQSVIGENWWELPICRLWNEPRGCDVMLSFLRGCPE